MNVGDVVGNYRITEILGEGGMGVVYLGTHKLIGREAAIKVLLPSLSNKQDVVQRFFNEAKTTTSIKHPGIVEVFDFGYSDQGHAYIVMERLEGETLEHRIRRLGRLPAEKATGLFGQIARALGAAHSLGVVHRDLKPANIYIVSDPDVSGGERAKILDFGIAKLRNAGNVGVRTQSGQLMGAPDYMAPEQCLGASEVDPRADLYAFGCMLFHAVTGKPPFIGASFAEVLAAHVSREPPRAKTMAPVPDLLDDLIYRLMQKAPDQRPQDTAAVLSLLKEAAGARPVGGLAPPIPRRTNPSTAPPPIPPSARRTMIAASEPPPVPAMAKMAELPAAVADSSAALPPLPRPRATLPPPVPRATASARTLYTDPSEAAKPAPRPGPLLDPRLASTMMSGNPRLSVPGPSAQPSAPLSLPPEPARSPPPQAPIGQPVASQPMPMNRPVQPAPMNRPVQPPPSAAGPHGPAAMPNAGSGQPVYPTRQPDPRRPMADPQYPVDMGPRRGNAVRPMQPTREGTSVWKVVLGVLLIGGASAGGFFVYKAASRNNRDAVAVAPSDASTTGADAGPMAAGSIDAAVVAMTTPDGGTAPANDAAAVATVPIDAAVIAIPTVAIDAAVVANVPPAVPDAAPVAVTNAQSGRVLDPDLKSAAGGDDGVETITLVIETRPPGAQVIRVHDQLLLGKTPIEFVTRKFNADESFEIRLAGYFSVTEKMSTFRNSKRLVPLLKKPQ